MLKVTPYYKRQYKIFFYYIFKRLNCCLFLIKTNSIYYIIRTALFYSLYYRHITTGELLLMIPIKQISNNQRYHQIAQYSLTNVRGRSYLKFKHNIETE